MRVARPLTLNTSLNSICVCGFLLVYKTQMGREKGTCAAFSNLPLENASRQSIGLALPKDSRNPGMIKRS